MHVKATGIFEYQVLRFLCTNVNFKALRSKIPKGAQKSKENAGKRF